MIWYIC